MTCYEAVMQGNVRSGSVGFMQCLALGDAQRGNVTCAGVGVGMNVPWTSGEKDSGVVTGINDGDGDAERGVEGMVRSLAGGGVGRFDSGMYVSKYFSSSSSVMSLLVDSAGEYSISFTSKN